MPTELHVTFTGLNLILAHVDGARAAVLQPDCRDGVSTAHEDGSIGVTHVGFLRFDLAHIEPRSVDDVLGGECVYRFNKQRLDFNLETAEVINIPEIFPLPDFGRFAPKLELLPKLLPPGTDTPLLMYTILEGGTFSDTLGDTIRAMPQVFDSPPAKYEQGFPNSVTWVRPLDADHVVISIRGFTTEEEITITLKAVSGVIRLQIANVCAKNPLAWTEFGIVESAQDDQDFKWLYRLLRHPDGSFKEKLHGSPFPIPRLVHDTASGVENCIGAILRGQTF